MDIFAFGLGYCALRLAQRQSHLWVEGTVRSQESVKHLGENGIRAYVFDGQGFNSETLAACQSAKTILVSGPPGAGGDPFLGAFEAGLTESHNLERVIYLSTVGVYGDWAGDWVDETSALRTASLRGRQRVAAEVAWQSFGSRAGVPVDILRLAGIYGPARNTLIKLREGSARRIVKPGQVFNRIHVDDIANVIMKIVTSGGRGEIWNVADEEPSAPQDVIVYGALLLGLPVPPEEAFDATTISEMSASFYSENRRVSIGKIKSRLAIKLLYPTYREGLNALAIEG